MRKADVPPCALFFPQKRGKRCPVDRQPDKHPAECGIVLSAKYSSTLRQVLECLPQSTLADCACLLEAPRRPGRAPVSALRPMAVKKRIRACTNAYHRMPDFYRFPTSITRANQRPSLVSLADIENRKRERTSSGMELSQKFPTFAIGGEDNSVQNKMRKRRSGMVWSTFNPPRKESLNKLPYEKYPVPVVHLSIRPDEKSCSI